MKKSKAIQPGEKPDIIQRMNETKLGDLFFHDDWERGNIFIRVTSISKKGDVKGEWTTDGITWEKWDNHGGYTIGGKHMQKIHMAEGETYQSVIQSLLSDFLKALIDPEFLDMPDEGESESKALIVTGGKKLYEDTAAAIERTRSRVEVMTILAKQKMDAIEEIARGLQKKLERIMRVIGILEVYLGVHEEIFQLTQGQPAPLDEPISIRQLVLYMDEEAGIVEIFHGKDGFEFDKDINFQSVDKFDQWLLQDNHLDVVLPEKRGVVALRPSRQDRYGRLDPWTKSDCEAADRMVYLLIRNGENLYRIWTSIMMKDTLFPTNERSKEIAKMFEEASSWDREKAEDEQSEYVKNMLLLQGLADRTQVFQPMPIGRVDFTKEETYEPGGRVRLIRDAENILTDGHIRFTDWREQINSKIARGTRIHLIGLPWRGEKEYNRRFVTNVWRNWFPPVPKSGIYTVEYTMKVQYHKNEVPVILYLPDDDIYPRGEWGGRERKKRIAFYLYHDEFINYDEFDLENVDYFLRSRLERRNYRQILPVLAMLRAERIKELNQEKQFVALLSQKHGIPENKLWNLVDWWKKKVINKRPIAQDDAKAWRMIIRKAKGLE